MCASPVFRFDDLEIIGVVLIMNVVTLMSVSNYINAGMFQRLCMYTKDGRFTLHVCGVKVCSEAGLA